VIGLNREKDRAAEAEFARRTFTHPTLLGMEQTFLDYHVDGLPCTVLIDRRGVLRRTFEGFGEGTEEELAAAVRELLEER